jgi:hypothetical protein
MLSRRERAVLQGIERELQSSDPSLASRLQGSPPVPRHSSLRLMWLLLAAVPTLAAVQAALFSHVLWAFVGFTAAVVTGCAYLVFGPDGRFERRSHG